jgi:hypothetical protein
VRRRTRRRPARGPSGRRRRGQDRGASRSSVGCRRSCALLLENVRREQAAVCAPPLPDVDGVVFGSAARSSRPGAPRLACVHGMAVRRCGCSLRTLARRRAGAPPVRLVWRNSRAILRGPRPIPGRGDKITLYRIGNPSAIVDALLWRLAGGNRFLCSSSSRRVSTRRPTSAGAPRLAGGHVVRGIDSRTTRR